MKKGSWIIAAIGIIIQLALSTFFFAFKDLGLIGVIFAGIALISYLFTGIGIIFVVLLYLQKWMRVVGAITLIYALFLLIISPFTGFIILPLAITFLIAGIVAVWKKI